MKFSKLLGGLLAACLAWSAPAWAEVDLFLKIEGIPGGSQAVGREGEIDMVSWQWGVTNSGSSGGGGTSVGKAVFEDFGWSQGLDIAVPKLFSAAATGRNLLKATFDAVREDGSKGGVFFQMIFDDVLITSLQVYGNSANQGAQAKLAYSRITLRYRPQKADGSFGNWVEGKFNLKDNEGAFSGNPDVILGLFQAGGTVAFDTPIGTIPEPSTWALMAGGVLLLGGVSRRRRPR